MRAAHQVLTATILLNKTLNFRLAIICLATASIGLSMAIISIAKLLLVLCGLATLLAMRQTGQYKNPLAGLRVPIAVLVILFAFTLSLIWTVAPLTDALSSVGKYGKLLEIILIVFLVRDAREAMCAFATFVAAQVFLLAGSWMLFFHLPVPWATSNMALTNYAVFSSYLDQSIMSGVFAAVCWHLRALFPGRFGPHFAVLAAILALCNVFFVLSGRTGHVVAILLLSSAIMWELPKRYRIVTVLLPFIFLVALSFGSSKMHQRIVEAQTEIKSFSFKKGADIATGYGAVSSSSGIRLHFWHRAVQSIGDNPILGAGAGSWASEYNRLEQREKQDYKPVQNGNPHQEYLLWGVQLGIPGIALLCGLMFSIFKDTAGMDKPYARAVQSTLLALAASCFFNASSYDALIGDFFCVLLGLLLVLGLRSPTHESAGQSKNEATA